MPAASQLPITSFKEHLTGRDALQLPDDGRCLSATMYRKPVPSIAVPASPQTPLPDLPFPTDKDLLVTTRNAVSIWEGSVNVRKIYRSVHDCVGAATRSEAGLLAVADGRVVVVEAKGTTRTRYHLNSGDGHISVLAYANNLQHLFFSTTLRHAVQRYSIVEDRLLDWFCMHPSPPTVLAISASSRYAISASRHPPTIYLSILGTQEPKHLLVRPHASVFGITAASFHPETEEYFLLAYADGTVSLHTASRIEVLHASGSDGSIGFLKRAHRVTNQSHYRHAIKHQKGGSSVDSAQIGAKSVSITAAAFVNGCKLRVVTVAGDGKCRMIDFERGAEILRTWSCASACTSLAIYSPQNSAAGHVSSRHIVAIGRVDGHVSLFDYAGILREERLADAAHRGIIGLQWTTRVSPQNLPADAGNGAGPVQPSFAQIEWKFAPDADRQSNDHDTLSRIPLSSKAGPMVSLPTSPRTLATPVSEEKNKAQWPLSPSSSAVLGELKANSIAVDRPKPPASSSPLLRSLRQGRLKPLSPRSPDKVESKERFPAPSHTPELQRPSPAAMGRPEAEKNDHFGTALKPSADERNRDRPLALDITEVEQGLKAQKDMQIELHQNPKKPPVAENCVLADKTPMSVAMTPQRSTSSVLKREGMPGSWVSEGDLTARRTQDRQRPKGPISQPPTPARRSRSRSTVQIVRQPVQSPTSPLHSNEAGMQKARHSPEDGPRGSPGGTSVGWETDSELSPVRQHQANRHRRLRRMTQHDNLALAEFKDRRDKLILPLTVDDNRPPLRSPPNKHGPPPFRSSSSYSVADSQAPHTNTPPPRTRRPDIDHVHENSSRLKPPRYYAQFLRRSRSKSSSQHHPSPHHHHRRSTDKPLPTDKSLPLLPPGFDLSPFGFPVSPPDCHECDCADVVREEMALVRAEVASLRKALWVFGSRIEGMSLSGSGMSRSGDDAGGVGLTGESGDPFGSCQ